MDDNVLVFYFFQILAADICMEEKGVQIKDKTLINTVLRRPPMNCAARDKEAVPAAG